LTCSTVAKEPAAGQVPPPKSPEVRQQAKPPETGTPPPPVSAPEFKAATGIKSEIGPKKILALLPIGAPSHHNVFSSIINELLKRGHHVTILSCRPQKTKHPRLREILFSDAIEQLFSKYISPSPSLRVIPYKINTYAI